MNGPNGSKISPAQTGSAKVFAVFPNVSISIAYSVCYRVHGALCRGSFRFPVSLLAAILEPEVLTASGRPARGRFNETPLNETPF
jgi:hypothetical protein